MLCKMCQRVLLTSSGNRGEMRGHANGCCLRRLLAYHNNRLRVRVEHASCVSCLYIWKYYASEADCRMSAGGVSLSQRAHTSLSASALFRERLKRAALSVKTQKCCFSNFTCKYSRNHSTIVFILCIYLILSDDSTIINQDFCAE